MGSDDHSMSLTLQTNQKNHAMIIVQPIFDITTMINFVPGLECTSTCFMTVFCCECLIIELFVVCNY